MLKGKRITVGITGGIAAYKAAEAVSWLTQEQAQVQVVMTASATRFISSLTMKTLSQRPVALDILSEDPYFQVPHIDVAQCDLFLILPATANFLAKAAHGLADDLLSAAVLATTAPILAFPAMNTHMYENPATQANLRLLAERGWLLAEPGEGRLACGTSGPGRLPELSEIKQAIYAALTPPLLRGQRVLVTAGPTYEYLDPVRFLGNRSSGKMGRAVAVAAQAAGAETTIIFGPCSLPDVSGAKNIRVTSAQEMYEAVWREYPDCDIVIMAAAVADYCPEHTSPHKRKKGGDEDLSLVRTPDILASLGQEKGDKLLVGFAAETENLAAYASAKLRQKNLDLLVANNVAEKGAGFDQDTNIVAIFRPGEEKGEKWPQMSKDEVARALIQEIALLTHK